MKSQNSLQNGLFEGIEQTGSPKPMGFTGVEPVRQGLMWNDPAAYEAVQALQQVDPTIGAYLYNPATKTYHSIMPVDYDPFNPSAGAGAAGARENGESGDEA